jgi:hypothetical protein
MSEKFDRVLRAVFCNPGRDWEEDFGHENGQYMNICCHCAQTFIGYKRRVVCKLCATPPAQEVVEEIKPAEA